MIIVNDRSWTRVKYDKILNFKNDKKNNVNEDSKNDFFRLVKSIILTNKLLHYVYDFFDSQTINRFLLYSHSYKKNYQLYLSVSFLIYLISRLPVPRFVISFLTECKCEGQLNQSLNCTNKTSIKRKEKEKYIYNFK